MLAQAEIRSRTTPLGKSGQIVDYASLTGKYHKSQEAISTALGLTTSTCSNIVRLPQHQRAENSDASDDSCENQNI